MIPSIKLMPKKWAQHQGPPRPPTETEKTTMADEKRKLDHREGGNGFYSDEFAWNLVTDHFGSGQLTGKALFVCFVNTMKINQSFWAAIRLRLLGQLTRFVFNNAVKTCKNRIQLALVGFCSDGIEFHYVSVFSFVVRNAGTIAQNPVNGCFLKLKAIQVFKSIGCPQSDHFHGDFYCGCDLMGSFTLHQTFMIRYFFQNQASSNVSQPLWFLVVLSSSKNELLLNWARWFVTSTNWRRTLHVAKWLHGEPKLGCIRKYWGKEKEGPLYWSWSWGGFGRSGDPGFLWGRTVQRSKAMCGSGCRNEKTLLILWNRGILRKSENIGVGTPSKLPATRHSLLSTQWCVSPSCFGRFTGVC